jgi:glutamyl-tRNA synthetase
MNIITRFPPSPTGLIHVGTAKTALLNYLFAKKHNGKVILRWEDTDKARSKKEYEQNIFETLEWLGLTFNEVHHQSERTLIYQKHIGKLIAEGKAYFSEESTVINAQEGSEEEDDDEVKVVSNEKRVIRFKNPNKVITFTDLLRGDISVDTTELGDFVIARTIEEPLYHLAVVIDDFEMGITHIIRGEDGIYNTPRQILIQEALGAPRPTYCHFPFILGADRSKLSKRNGSIPVSEYKNMGILPDAFINYLALLGWNPGTTQEIFTREELIEAFSLERIQKSGAIFDLEKLLWFNREHIKRMPDLEFKKQVLSFLPEQFKALPQWSDERLTKALSDIKERISTLKDVAELAESGDFTYFFATPTFTLEALIPKAKKGESITLDTVAAHLQKVIELLDPLSETSWNKEAVKGALWDYATEVGRAEVLWPLRFLLSGRDKSPDPFTLSEILGKQETLTRIKSTLSLISPKA